MLKVSDVSKVLGARRILDGISFELGPGDVGVVLGENGSGKSTLLRVVAGIILPDRGSIVVDNASLARDEKAAKRQMGYVPDATEALPDLTAREFIALIWDLKNPSHDLSPRPGDREMARFGLSDVGGNAIAALSFGQRKRMCLLAATCGDPWLLVLDEPSNGLDPEGVKLVTEMIAKRRERGQATLLSTNDMPFAESLGGKNHRIAAGKLTSIGPLRAALGAAPS